MVTMATMVLMVLPALERLKKVGDKALDSASRLQISPPNHFICPILKVCLCNILLAIFMVHVKLQTNMLLYHSWSLILCVE
jgi:hypothetical protein